jgi:ABC-type amino acid transport substrate-binding protein
VKTLRVGAAFPDPPFNGMPGDGGLDIDLMRAIGAKLGAEVEFIPYEGEEFDGIFDGLAVGAYDCVASGVTVTPERERKALFAPPYVISGQAMAVDTRRGADHPDDVLVALAPRLAERVKSLPGVQIVKRGLSVEHIAIAVAPGDQALLSRIAVAQAELEDDGTLQGLRRKWLGNPYTDQSLAVH